jgi:hypothetical protein
MAEVMVQVAAAVPAVGMAVAAPLEVRAMLR